MLLRYVRIGSIVLFLTAGCSSNKPAEIPKDAKPAPTVVPAVRDAGAGLKPG